MYRRKKQVGQLVVCLIDLVLVLVCAVLGGLLRYHTVAELRRAENVQILLWVLGLFHIALYYIMNIYGTLYTRDRYHEAFTCVSYNLVLVACAVLFGFSMKIEVFTSRLVFGYFAVLNTVAMFVAHVLIRNQDKYFHTRGSRVSNILIIAETSEIPPLVRRFLLSKEMSWHIAGVVPLAAPEGTVNAEEPSPNLLSSERIGVDMKKYPEIPILSLENEEYMEFATRHPLDEVFVQVRNLRSASDFLEHLILNFEQMGVVVNVSLNLEDLDVKGKRQAYNIGEIPVVAFSSRLFDYRMVVLKRAIDIVGSIVGLLITAVVSIFVIPAIKLESPGPVIFKQKRVGMNGRIFDFYKFRSMYKDAEERKKELMAQNEMNGLMFKMENDPRITKVGAFIRKTSIDELPQFWNVLKGDMSLVGTRPPTVDEYMQYNAYQKRRISFRPGITGLWQVSGRSDIKDFDEVVRLDLEYIDNWSLGLDIKLLVETVGIVFKGKGAS